MIQRSPSEKHLGTDENGKPFLKKQLIKDITQRIYSSLALGGFWVNHKFSIHSQGLLQALLEFLYGCYYPIPQNYYAKLSGDSAD